MDPHKEVEQANRRAREFDASHPRVLTAQLVANAAKIRLHLSDGKDFEFSPHDIEDLENATLDQLEPIEISPSGHGLYFPKLDADIWVPGLLEGVFGSKKWMSKRNAPHASNQATRPQTKIAV
jgi:hypothetical protein